MSLGNMEQRTEGMKRQAQDLIEQAYNRGYRAGQDLASVKMRELVEQGIEQGIEQGQKEAWEAAQRIHNSWGTENCLLDNLFGTHAINNIFKCSAKEVVNKIREYDEAQRKQETDEEIEVGDEILDKVNNRIGLVTHVPSGQQVLYSYVTLAGTYTVDRKSLSRTGQHYSDIVKVLLGMEGR